jgi:hypothetical protein
MPTASQIAERVQPNSERNVSTARFAAALGTIDAGRRR